jgi:predicted KAP-like P-loop ATPase
MWSDNEATDDFIDFNPLIEAAASIIDSDHLHPCTIGLFGNWGSGKSSLMQMLYTKYNGREGVLALHFNGWLFEGYEDAKTVLMGQLIEEIAQRKTLSEEALEVAARLLKRVDWMKVASVVAKQMAAFAIAGPMGNLATSALGNFSDFDYRQYLKEKQEASKEKPAKKETLRAGLHSFHADFEELLAKTDIKKIVVFIDDLDRCEPDTVIGTLEAIKLFLFSKRSVFVIGADERLIRYAVRKRFPELPGDRAEVGRDYLEKLIQFPVVIPPLNVTELVSYINLLFVNLHCPTFPIRKLLEHLRAERCAGKLREGFSIKNAAELLNQVDLSMPDDLKDSLQISYQITPLLARGLNGNPRQCKRFLNMMLMRQGVAEQKGLTLQKRILAKLMLLEYCKPEFFRKFAHWQEASGGIIHQLKGAEHTASDKPTAEPAKQNGKEPKPKAVISPEITELSADSWFEQWLSIEPALADDNLSEYFYIARDTSSMVEIFATRMSSAAQDVFQKLLDDKATIRNQGLEQVNHLSETDATALFESFADRIRQHEGKFTGEHTLLTKLLDYCQRRTDQLPSLLLLLESLPETQVPVSLPPALKRITDPSYSKSAVEKLLSRWRQSSHKPLASAAQHMQK